MAFDSLPNWFPMKLLIFQAALSNTGIPKVQITSGSTSDEQPEVDISDDEFLQFDTSRFPVIVTLTKVIYSINLCH